MVAIAAPSGHQVGTWLIYALLVVCAISWMTTTPRRRR